jgi:hypothetical protein
VLLKNPSLRCTVLDATNASRMPRQNRRERPAQLGKALLDRAAPRAIAQPLVSPRSSAERMKQPKTGWPRACEERRQENPMNKYAFALLAILPVVGLVSLAETPEVAHAQSKCTSGSKVSLAIWEKWGEEIKKHGCKSSEECLNNAGKREKLVKEMIKFWNEQSGNGWATIGPREILFEGKLDGKIVAGGERLFVTKYPLEEGDEITVEVKKEGGKAPATVSLSSLDADNKCVTGADVSFAGDAANGTKKVLSIKGAKGRIVTIKVDADKGKAFDYELVVRRK